jgi:cytochrome c oxidase subunit I
VFATYSLYLLAVTQIFFFINFFRSLKKGRLAGNNPWNANSLEWTAPSPPPHGNFAKIPSVYRGPYEFSHPDNPEQDFWPQDVEGPVKVKKGDS